MGIEELSLFSGVISAVVLGWIWVRKNWYKPVVKWFSGIEEIKNVILNSKDVEELIKKNTTGIDINSQRLDSVDGKLNALMQLDDTPLFVCDEYGLCVFANDAICDVFQSTADEMHGNGWIGFVIQEDRARVLEEWMNGLKSGNKNIIIRCVIERGSSGEKVKLRYHAILWRQDKTRKVIVSVGKVDEHK